MVVGYLKNLINSCKSWFSWYRTILNPSIFRKILQWIEFELYSESTKKETWTRLKRKDESDYEPLAVDKPEPINSARYRRQTEPRFSLLCGGRPPANHPLCAVDRPVNCHIVFFHLLFFQVFFSSNLIGSFLIISSWKQGYFATTKVEHLLKTLHLFSETSSWKYCDLVSIYKSWKTIWQAMCSMNTITLISISHKCSDKIISNN